MASTSPNVKLVPLGKDGPLVPQLGFGLMGMSYAVYGAALSDEERFKILDRAWEIGARFWDSADLYGDSEALLAKWFKRTGRRDDIFLATKFGFVKGGATFELDSSYAYCKKACEESLRVLGVDCIDLYYLHHANPETPIEETMRALKELQEEGKIKHIGLSAISSKTLIRASKIAKVAAAQVDYSPFVLDIEGPSGNDLLATCRSLGVALVAATPLNRGIITSTFADGTPLSPETDEKDMRPKVMPRFLPANAPTNAAITKKFGDLAAKHNCTVSQLALAWLMKQGDDIIPIPGTKQIKYLEQNWGALEVQLSESDEKEVRAFLEKARDELAGGAMPKAFEAWNYRDTVEEVVA